jgi:hypothetical protein
MNRLNKTFPILIVTLAASGAPVANGAFFGDPPDDHHPWAVHD